MIRATVVCALIAGPSWGQTRMTPDLCVGGWTQGIDAVADTIPDFIQGDVFDDVRRNAQKSGRQMTPDGWCLIDDLGDVPAETMAWRGRGMDAFINDKGVPEQIEIRLTGVTIENNRGGPYTINTVITHDPDDGEINIALFHLISKDNTLIELEATIGGAFFRDIGGARMSFGGLHLDTVTINAEMTPSVSADLIPGLSGDEIVADIAQLTFAQLDLRSKTEVTQFARALPNARGDLSLRYESDTGLGFLQMGMAERFDGPERLAFLLSGAQVLFDWEP